MEESTKKMNGLMSAIRFFRSAETAEGRDTWYGFIKEELENYYQERAKECFAHCVEQTNPLRNTTLDQDQRAAGTP